MTVDYTCPPGEVFRAFASAISACESRLVVGTSMGGFFAAWLGSELGLPFIAINPAIEPGRSLRKYIGPGTTHFGVPFILGADVVDAYDTLPFRLDGKGIVALDLGDEVIDSRATILAVGERLPLLAFDGGSHRFEHMRELGPAVREMMLGAG